MKGEFPIVEVITEANEAERRYGAPASSHESLGVLMEEIQELIEAVRGHDANAVTKEAIQVSAVALRLAACCMARDPAFLARSRLDRA